MPFPTNFSSTVQSHDFSTTPSTVGSIANPHELKDDLYDAFSNHVAATISTAAQRPLVFSLFLCRLADVGGSELVDWEGASIHFDGHDLDVNDICNAMIAVDEDMTLQRILRCFADEVVTALGKHQYRTSFWTKWGAPLQVNYTFGFPAALYAYSHNISGQQRKRIAKMKNAALMDRSDLREGDAHLHEALLQGGSRNGPTYMV